MQHRRFISALLVVLLMAALYMTGCSNQKPGPEPTPSETTTPTQSQSPTDPTDPPVLTAHQKLAAYLKENGPAKVEDKSFTFTMKAEGEKILWIYNKDAVNITITLSDGAAKHPVTIKFNQYDATAEVEVATFSSVTPQLSSFQCRVAQMAEPLRMMATSAVTTCFLQAAKAMAPSGIDLIALGFTQYYN